MRNRAFRSIAAILSILLLTGVPTHAAPIVVSDVIQVLSNYRNSPELRLRSASQNSASLASGVKGSVQFSAIDGSLKIGDPTVVGPIGSTVDSLLAGLAIGSDSQTIDVVAQGDVEATVCDCGEITVPGGGWPKWPLLFLAAIPFFFINDCADCDIPTPTPTPPPPTPTPEPASLLLLGTGLIAFGAGFRRRYSRAQLKSQMRATKEEA
jgi:PEP-CTERM motif